jgi:hypothetical protein
MSKTLHNLNAAYKPQKSPAIIIALRPICGSGMGGEVLAYAPENCVSPKKSTVKSLTAHELER